MSVYIIRIMVDLAVVKPLRFTRYFTFVKVNPKAEDYEKLKMIAVRLGAFMGYRVMEAGGRKYLAGFLVLYHHRAFIGDIHPYFPNFLIKPMNKAVDWDVVEETYDRVFGEHPFSGVRRNLFP